MRDGRDMQLVIAAGDQEVRSRIRKCAEGLSGIRIAAECSTAEETGRCLAGTPADLLILDTALPESGGFSFLRSLAPDRRPAVVFTATSEDQAVAAFQFHPIDFLMLPFDEERLASAIRRAHEQSAPEDVPRAGRRTPYAEDRRAEPA